MGTLGTVGDKGFGSSNLGVAWGRRLKDALHTTEATSRRSGLTSRCFRGFISQRRDVETNIAKFQKGEITTS